MWRLDNDNLKAGFSPVLHRGYAVCVIRDQHDSVSASIFGIRGDVKANSHVNSLLFKVRDEISIGQLV